MAAVFEAQMDGLDRLQRNLDDPKTVGQPVRVYLDKVTAEAHRRVIANLRPRNNTGRTATSVFRKIDGRPIPNWGEVKSNYFIARMVEYGSKPHFPKVDGALEQWARSRGLDPWAVAVRIARRGVKRRSPFNRAKFATRRLAPKFAEEAGREIVQRIGGGPGGI